MSTTETEERQRGAERCDFGNGPPPGAAGWLSLAAAPTFAVMALLALVPGGESHGMGTGSWPLQGMSLMYLLMSLFHSVPWLRLISDRQSSG